LAVELDEIFEHNLDEAGMQLSHAIDLVGADNGKELAK
jgi:hypothetical protein